MKYLQIGDKLRYPGPEKPIEGTIEEVNYEKDLYLIDGKWFHRNELSGIPINDLELLTSIGFKLVENPSQVLDSFKGLINYRNSRNIFYQNSNFNDVILKVTPWHKNYDIQFITKRTFDEICEENYRWCIYYHQLQYIMRILCLF